MIETSTKCHCGAHVVLALSDGAMPWLAWCPDCLDPSEDAGPLAHVRGSGESPDRALWDWADQLEVELAVEYQPADAFGELALQVDAEAARQRGWVRRHAGSRVLYGPAAAA